MVNFLDFVSLNNKKFYFNNICAIELVSPLGHKIHQRGFCGTKGGSFPGFGGGLPAGRVGGKGEALAGGETGSSLGADG